MSDHEFNNYLTLLAGLLRLGDKQRRAIAEELRTHLEDRLDELVARGVTKDEAIRQALSEFGDAAGLAAQFASISGGRRRRWLMRAMTFSVAAILLMAAGLAIFWPGRNAGPGAAFVAAQATKAADPAQPPKAEPAALPAKPRIDEVLNRRMDLDATEKPLKDVVSLLTDQMGVTFHLDLKTLTDAGVNVDAPVTVHFRNLRLGTLLDLMLRDLDLTYADREELILITTPDAAESQLEIRIYDCRDLLGWPWPPTEKRPASDAGLSGNSAAVTTGPTPGALVPIGKPKAGEAAQMSVHDERAKRLMTIVRNSVDPQSWDEVGGPGSIEDYYGLFVVSQTDRIHRQVERFLDKLREAAGIDEPKPVKAKVVR